MLRPAVWAEASPSPTWRRFASGLKCRNLAVKPAQRDMLAEVRLSHRFTRGGDVPEADAGGEIELIHRSVRRLGGAGHLSLTLPCRVLRR
jgi:hypothetical protein